MNAVRIPFLSLVHGEDAAAAAGFTRCEMGATLTGVKLFGAKGYVALENISVPLKNGEGLPVVRMAKQLM